MKPEEIRIGDEVVGVQWQGNSIDQPRIVAGKVTEVGREEVFGTIGDWKVSLIVPHKNAALRRHVFRLDHIFLTGNDAAVFITAEARERIRKLEQIASDPLAAMQK